MKLDRNINGIGRGKYGLIKTRRLAEIEAEAHPHYVGAIDSAMKVLEGAGIIDWGDTPDTEFFVMRLKDKFTSNALFAYAIGADACGESEYAKEVLALSKKSANHPNRKIPD